MFDCHGAQATLPDPASERASDRTQTPRRLQAASLVYILHVIEVARLALGENKWVLGENKHEPKKGSDLLLRGQSCSPGAIRATSDGDPSRQGV